MVRNSVAKRERRLIQSLGRGVFIITALVLAGCSTTTSQSFNVVKDSAVEKSYIATDANFGKYRNLLGKDMGIHFPTNAPQHQ